MSNGDPHSRDRKAISASLIGFCRIGLPDSDCIDLALASVGLEESIMAADAGDQNAKTRMRHLAACYLSSDKFGPIPAVLGRSAARELEKLSKGTPDPNRPNGGHPPRAYRKKMVIAHWIHKAIKEQGVSQNRACADLAERINKEIDSQDDYGHTEIRSPEALRKIYREVLRDIEALYEEVQKIKATVVPIRCVD